MRPREPVRSRTLSAVSRGASGSSSRSTPDAPTFRDIPRRLRRRLRDRSTSRARSAPTRPGPTPSLRRHFAKRRSARLVRECPVPPARLNHPPTRHRRPWPGGPLLLASEIGVGLVALRTREERVVRNFDGAVSRLRVPMSPRIGLMSPRTRRMSFCDPSVTSPGEPPLRSMRHRVDKATCDVASSDMSCRFGCSQGDRRRHVVSPGCLVWCDIRGASCLPSPPGIRSFCGTPVRCRSEIGGTSGPFGCDTSCRMVVARKATACDARSDITRPPLPNKATFPVAPMRHRWLTMGHRAPAHATS